MKKLKTRNSATIFETRLTGIYKGFLFEKNNN